MEHYQEKIAIVTGGAAGIGRSLCLALAREGAHVVVAGHHEDRVERVAQEIRNQGGQAWSTKVDVTRQEDVQEVIESTIQKHGRLDYLFNNAGISIAGEMRDLSLEDWSAVLDVNLMGVLYGTHYAYQKMILQGHGHIVNISSLGGLLPFPVKAPYAATKHAVTGLTSTLRAEAAGLGVRVSLVCPGLIKTQIWDKTRINKASNKDVASILMVPMLDVDKAARAILKGVRKNKGIIVFPLHAKLAWWTGRLCPCLLAPMGWYMMRRFRKIRRSEGP